MIIKHLGKTIYFSKRLFEDLKIYVNHVVNEDEDMVMDVSRKMLT